MSRFRLPAEMAKTRKKPTILLLGGSGFVGACFRSYAVERGWKVQAPDSSVCDLRDLRSVDQFAKKIRSVDAIICAASAREDRESFLGAQKNIDIAFGCARLVELLRPGQLVYLSSVDVYGRPPSKAPIHEGTTLKLDSPYSVSKFASENILRIACDRVKARCVILRLPGVFGRNDDSNRIVAGMLRAGRENTVFSVNGDGRQKRDLVWNDDIARLIGECIARKTKSCLVNVATGESFSVLQMLNAFRRLGIDVNVVFKKGPKKDFDLTFDTPRLRKELGSFRFTPFETALSETTASR